MTEAILEGEYTEELRNTLLKQKLEVLEMCEMEKVGPTAGNRFKTTKATEQPYSYHHEAHQTGSGAEAGSSSAFPNVQSRPSRCSYRACYHCDRKLEERTWVSLNGVCDDPNVQPPSAWDLWETPVSNADHVKNLGLRPPRPPPPPPHSSQYSQHTNRPSHRLNLRRSTGQYFAAYESSLSVGLTSNLNTIEEMKEEMEEMDEMETLSIGALKRNRRPDIEAQLPEAENQKPECSVSKGENE